MSPTLEIPSEVLAALAVPPMRGMDEDRAAGRACVWGGERLSIETAVDLGEQQEGNRAYFPRACRACLTDRAQRAHFAHGSLCAGCRADSDRGCPLGAGLAQLVADCPPDSPAPAGYGFCAWHKANSEDVRLIQMSDAGSGLGDRGRYACRPCRKIHRLVPLSDRP